MLPFLRTIGWLACVVYSTIPSFWFLVHPQAEYWRSHKRSPYRILLPAWIAMWFLVAFITARWRHIALYTVPGMWFPAAFLFAAGVWVYFHASRDFSAKQLGGVPEVHGSHREQRLVTSGIRSRVRHPVYLGHLLEMLAWSLGTGLAVCYGLTVFALLTGAVMIRMEDVELERRFGDQYRSYRESVPAVIPRL